MSTAEEEVERIIMLRGVVWRGEGVDSFKLWQDLMRFWPTAFAREHTRPEGVILAHAGTFCFKLTGLSVHDLILELADLTS